MENEQQKSEEPDLPQQTKEQIQSLLHEAAQKKQWRREIEENQALQQHFAGFIPDTVNSFIDRLIHDKMSWLKYGPHYLEKMETDGLEWIDDAFEHLGNILQKKLFDVQCLWRAEKVKLETVEVCFDFYIWEKNVFNCPFIEPIEKADVELYIKYLQKAEDVYPYGWMGRWQEYEEIKEAYETDNENRDFPEWYDFHNLHKGTSVYMLLPDIRGQKEEFYETLFHEAHKEENEKRYAAVQKETDKRPRLAYYEKEYMKWYVETFESKDIQKLYNAYEWNNNKWQKGDSLDTDLFLLQQADEYVPIEAHYNWIEAVQKAANKYRMKKIADAMPQAWEQYMMNIQMGIAFPNESGYEDYKDMRERFNRRIIEGRILNGEPGDLHF